MTKITALIITYNEEKHIGACIDSLQDVADEVIVVDSSSTDKTREIAERKGARFIEKSFAGFGAQKNLGAEAAAHDYILSIDADEILSATLRQSIMKLKESLTTGSYYVNRLNHLGTKAIKTCGWYPDTRIRLYHRLQAHWDSRAVHEELILSGQPVFLEGDLLHYSFEDFADMRRRMDKYAGLGTDINKGKNAFSLLIKMLINPVAKFAKTYFLQGGIADGYTGWMISWHKARETFYKYYWALG